MGYELNWGLPVIGYLFLAGLGAGVLTVSASVFLRGHGGGFGNGHFAIARYGALIAPIPVITGTSLLVFELGSFHVGNWFKWLNLYKTITLSPMSIGTWLLTFFIVLSLVYAYTFLRLDASTDDKFQPLRKALAWLLVPLGIAVAVYTGVLLGAMPSRPFWNSPILPMLFLLSALSTGVAALLLTRALLHKGKRDPDIEQSSYLLTTTDMLLIGFELVVVFLFIMFAYLTVGDVQTAVAVILPGGSLAALFWFWFVLVGLLVPVLVELYYVIPRLLYQRQIGLPYGVEIVVPIVVLIGGFILRYVVVIAGQITGPVGI
ncbi:MAG: polysulfide reductase NrfD [Gammaproteobacteria bacterium]|nr:MAG: polysulfide reductase NrfD [Gammaproteobacteria bacterium]